MELKEYRFDKIALNFDKKRIPLSGAQREKRKGKYRYYGGETVYRGLRSWKCVKTGVPGRTY